MSGFFFLRHGQTDMNIRHMMQGRVNTHLNETGRRQARKAAEFMRENGICPDEIYTSPLVRTIETAEEAKSLDMSYDQDQYIHWNYSDPDGDPFVPEGDNVSDVQVLDLYYYDNDPYFIYDPETGDYTRYEFGEKQIDKITGEDVTVKNIIIEKVLTDLKVSFFYPLLCFFN